MGWGDIDFVVISLRSLGSGDEDIFHDAGNILCQ